MKLLIYYQGIPVIQIDECLVPPTSVLAKYSKYSGFPIDDLKWGTAVETLNYQELDLPQSSGVA
jgi:hypothetical protein